jgi:hypothetical protein
MIQSRFVPRLESAMIGWISLVTTILAAILWWGGQPVGVFYASLIVMAASFTTFCLAYDDPMKRAGHRVNERMSRLSSKGVDFEEHQRLQSMTIKANDDDKRFRLTMMTGINLAAGTAGLGLVIWGLMSRFG